MTSRAVGRRLLWAGLAAFAVSVWLLASGPESFSSFFYICAWWSLIAVLEGALKRRTGRALLIDNPWMFVRMALFSVPFWLAYELINVRLQNWQYLGVPQHFALRWVGYGAAYATVLPAILETARLIEAALPGMTIRKLRVFSEPSFEKACRTAGLACLFLPLAWPTIFFPLVWAAVFLLFEPILSTGTERSWLRSLAEGRPRPAAALLLSGLVCGLLWESLNFWAGAKWTYTIPWPAGPKLFEMPLLGYLGFLPFALGCASAWRAAGKLWRTLTPSGRAGLAALLVEFAALACWAIDENTVQSWVRIW